MKGPFAKAKEEFPLNPLPVMLVALLFAHSLGYAADLKMMGRPCLEDLHHERNSFKRWDL